MRTFLLAGLAAGSLMAGPARAQMPVLPELPVALKPSGMSPYLQVSATGVQCTCAVYGDLRVPEVGRGLINRPIRCREAPAADFANSR